MCPGVFGENVRDMLWTPLASKSFISSIFKNSISEVNFIFVIFSSPKLNNVIAAVDFSLVRSSSNNKSGSCFRSCFIFGMIMSSGAGRIMGTENFL